jgi:parvulin-like peptidyl-prolyl isomerase
VPAAAREQAESREVVVARIGAREITLGEVQDRLDSLPVFVRMRYQSAERKLEFLEAYVQFQVLALAADAEGLGAAPSTRDALKTDLAERFLREQADATVKTTDIPEERVVEYFRTHPDEFSRPEQSEVLGIRVKDKALAEKVAFRARRKVEGGGADARPLFVELVEKHSDDEATRRAGGEYGRFPRLPSEPRKVPAAVEEAASKLTAPGDLAGPIEAEDGFHVLFAARRVPAVEQTLDSARTQIVSTLMDARRAQVRRELIDGLVARAGVTIDEAAFRKVAGLEDKQP